MTQLLGGEVLARALVANGIDTIFGIPGVQLDPFFAGLHDVKDKVRIIHARHEQGVALMAFGYAHVTGKASVMTVVPGPGFLNAATGLLTAHACNTPMLCLVGQSERMFIGSGVGVLHELENQIGIAKSLSKWAHRVEDEEKLSSDVAEAFNQINSYRPRPVYLELPSDILRMNVKNSEPVIKRSERLVPSFDQQTVEATAKKLAEAKFPLIMAGGGCANAGGVIKQLAELLGAPVGMSENGLGTLDARHPLAFTQLSANKLWGRSDVVLGLGTRLYAPVYNWGFDEDQEIIKVDIDATELNRLPCPITGVLAELEAFVEALCLALPQYIDKPKDLSAAFKDVRKASARDLEELVLPGKVMQILREELGEEGILITDVTQLNHPAMDMYPVYAPHTYISSGYQGTLGFGLCTALGAKLGKPEAPVVCLTGDGGFMYAAQELASAMQFDIPVVTVVVNDGAYKNVEGILNRSYGGRAIATSLENPDFLKFAESFGVEARRVTNPEELQIALHELLALNKPALIDFEVSDIPSAFWLRFLPQVRKHKPQNDYGLVKSK